MRRALLVALLLPILIGPLHAQTTAPSRDDRLIARYRRAVEARPVRGPAFERLCALYDAGPGLGALINTYREAARRDPARPAFHLILGHIEMHRGRPRDALPHYREAVRRDPKGFVARFSLGEAYAEAGDLKRAADALSAAAPLAGSDDQRRSVYRRLGDVHARAGRWDAARAAWREVVDLDPADIAGRLELARALERFGRLAEAIDVHREIIALPGIDPARVVESHRAIGRLNERLGRTEQAVTAYLAALDLTAPDSWLRRQLRREIAGAARAAGRSDWLITRYEARLAGETTRAERIEQLVALADLLAQSARPDDAVARHREALALDPADHALRRRLADFLADEGRHADAADELQRLAQDQPNNADLQFEFLQALVAAGRKEEADHLRTALRRRFAANRDVLLRLAETCRQQGRGATAAAIYCDLLKRNAADVEAGRALALIEHAEGRPEGARRVLEALAAARPDDAAVHLAVAEAFDELGLNADAVAAYRRAADAAPQNDRALRGLAFALTAARRFDEAMKAWKTVKDRAGGDYWRDRADEQMLGILTMQGLLDQARADHERRLAEHPDDVETGLFLAKIYLRLNDVAGAVRTYEALLRARPTSVPVQTALAAAHERRGAYAEARDAYRALAESDRPNRRRHLESVVTQCLRLSDRPGALAAAKAIAADAPSDPKAHVRLAEVHYHFRDYDAALAAYDEAIRLAPTAFDYVDAKARVLDALGRTDDASVLYRRVLRTSTDKTTLTRVVRELVRLAPRRADLDRLADLLQGRVRREPRNWVWYDLLARVYRALGDEAGEKRILTDGLRQASDRPAALQALMACCERHGLTAEAITYGEDLLARTARPTASQYQHLIELLLRGGRAARADRLARQWMARQRPDVNTYRTLFVLYASEGRPAEAARWLEGLLTLTPADASTRLRLARIHEELGRLAEAEHAYRRILDAPPAAPAAASQPTIPPKAPPAARADDLRRAYLDPGFSPPRSGDGSGSTATVFRQYVPETAPEHARREALYGLIRVAEADRRLAALAAEFRERLARAPKREQAHLDLIAVVQAAGDGAAIIEAYTAAARALPDRAAWQSALAEAARKLGRWRDAARAYETLANLEPAAAAAHLADAVRMFLAGDDDRRMAAFLKRRVTLRGTDPAVTIGVATALDEGGRVAKAADLAESLLDRPDVCAVYGQTLGGLLAGAGRPKAAVRAYLGRFERPVGPGLDDVWASLEARRAALTPAWRLMTPDARARFIDRLAADARGHSEGRGAHERLAVAAQAADRADDRLAALDRLVAIVPGDDELPYQVINTHRRLGRPKTATDLAIRLINGRATPTGRRDVCLRLINTYGNHDPGDRLAAAIETAYLGARPTAADLRNMASALIRWRRNERGTALLERALELEPDDRRTALQLADLYRRTGRLKALRALYDRLAAATPLPPAPAAATASADLYASREALLLPVIEVHRNANGMASLIASAERRRAAHPDALYAAYDLAILQRSAGRPDLAVTVLETAVAGAPTDPWPRAALAAACMQTGRYDRAIEAYRALLRMAPTMTRTVYRRLADCYAQTNRTEERLATLTELAGRFRDAEVYGELARLYRTLGRPAEARRAFRRHLDLSAGALPGSEYELHQRLARFLVSMDDVDGAMQVLRDGARRVRLRRDGRTQARYLLDDLLDVAAEAGRLPRLVEDLEKQAKDRPEDDDLLLTLARALNRQGAHDREVAMRQRLADLAPADLERAEHLARAHLDAKQYDKAARAYQALAARAPDRSAAYLADAALAAFRAGRTAEAVGLWWRSAAEGYRRSRGTPLYRSAAAYYETAVTFESHALWDEAEKAYRRALDLAAAPTYDLYGGAVRLFMRRHKAATALEIAAAGLARTGPGPERTSLIQGLLPYGEANRDHLRRMADALAGLPVLATDADLAVEVHRTIAERFTSVGDHAGAAAAYEAARRRAPQDAGLRRALADALSAAGRHAEAARLYREVLADSPADYSAMSALAETLAADGKADEAVQQWQAFLEGLTDSAAAQRLAGTFFRDHDRPDLAVKAFEAAVRLEPTDLTNYVRLAETERRRGHFPAAVKALEAARPHVGTDGQRRALERALLRVYEEAKMLPALIDERRREIEATHGRLVSSALALARALDRAGRVDEARAAYRRVIHLAPDSAEARAAREALAGGGGG